MVRRSICLVAWLTLATAATFSFAGGPAGSPDDVRPLMVGAEIPELTLTTGEGEAFDLNAAIAADPTILLFYRGGW